MKRDEMARYTDRELLFILVEKFDWFSSAQKEIEIKVNKNTEAIIGNGSPGLKQRVNTVEDIVLKRRAWYSDILKLVIAGTLGGSLAAIIPAIIH